MLESKNMQYAFQVEYPNKALNIDKAADMNKELVNVLTQDLLDEAFAFSTARVEALTGDNTYSFKMRVLYPGLLMGTGYPHMTGKPDGEIQIGFSFDYVTGLPYYPGSSLKGVLRNPFDRAVSSIEYLDYLRDIFAKPELTVEEVKTFVGQTFAGCEQEAEGLPMSQRDVFYDSYPIGFASNGAPAKLLNLDNLAPHLDKETKKSNPLKDPVPLTMLRVMPNTCFAFQMKLHDVVADEGKVLFTATEKLQAFKTILMDFGIGAKTRVGYGNLAEVTGEIVTRLQQDISSAEKDNEGDKNTQNDNNIPADAGEPPVCQMCHTNKAAYNHNAKMWGKLCPACLEKKRKEKKPADKKNKVKKQAKTVEEPMDENMKKLMMLKNSMNN